LVQCFFNEIMIFHLCITSFGVSIYTVRSWYAINIKMAAEVWPA
jgi:hypothetical protein